MRLNTSTSRLTGPRQEVWRDFAGGGRCVGLIDLRHVWDGIAQHVGEHVDVGR